MATPRATSMAASRGPRLGGDRCSRPTGSSRRRRARRILSRWRPAGATAVDAALGGQSRRKACMGRRQRRPAGGRALMRADRPAGRSTMRIRSQYPAAATRLTGGRSVADPAVGQAYTGLTSKGSPESHVLDIRNRRQGHLRNQRDPARADHAGSPRHRRSRHRQPRFPRHRLRPRQEIRHQDPARGVDRGSQPGPRLGRGLFRPEEPLRPDRRTGRRQDRLTAAAMRLEYFEMIDTRRGNRRRSGGHIETTLARAREEPGLRGPLSRAIRSCPACCCSRR